MDHIPTTHVGSLPRPAELLELLHAKKKGRPYDEQRFRAVRRDAVRELVARQRAIGLDIVNDGEAGRVSFSAYVFDRIGGFGDGPPAVFHIDDLDDFPAFRDEYWAGVLGELLVPYCVGPVTHEHLTPLQEEIEDLEAAVDSAGATGEAFMNAPSPGQLAFSFPNSYYPSWEDYVFALSDAMKPEYEAVAAAGLTLQIDSPDLAMSKSVNMNDYRPDFQWYIGMAIDALNHALENIPADQLRLHVCWGNGAWPHRHDAELKEILPTVLKAKPRVISIEASNPRHAHEWQVFEEIPLPDEKVVMPGVIDTTTTFIEHPDLVAQRLGTFARVVGRDRVIAGTDCGMATHAEHPQVHPEIAWAKLESLVEGAHRVSERLW